MTNQESRLRSKAQNLRDTEEAKLKRKAQAAKAAREQHESDYQRAEATEAAAHRREEQLKKITAEELAKMTPAEIAKAYDAGLIDHLTGPVGAPTPSTEATAEETAEESANGGQPAKVEASKPVTPEDLGRMAPAEIAKAYDAGLIDHLIKPVGAPAPTPNATVAETAGASEADGDRATAEAAEEQDAEPVTPEELAKMTPEEVIAAYKAGRFTPKTEA